MRTMTVRMSVRIRAGCSGYSLFVDIYSVSIISVCGQRMPRSACANAQDDLGLCCPQISFHILYPLEKRLGPKARGMIWIDD